MTDDSRYNSKFVSYDYKQICTNINQASFLIDAYRNFGWIIDDNINQMDSNNINLQLKRDRKIINKMELTRLQRNFEFCFKDIENIEKRKSSSANVAALCAGILGTAFMTGAVFAYLASPPMIALSILLAIPGLAGWIAPCFLHKYILHKSILKNNLLIEEKREEIFRLCEKGYRLLND